jgi:hypothetical protein
MKSRVWMCGILVICGMLSIAALEHKFYYSNTTIFLNPRTQVTECTVKLFYDDLELALLQQSGKKLQFHGQSSTEIGPYLADYLRSHFQLYMDNALVNASWVGYELEGDLVICFFEYVYPQSLHSIEVKSDVLVAQFPDQKNVIQVEYNGSTQTILLDKNKTAQTVHY